MKKSPRPPCFYTLEQWKEIIEDWLSSQLSIEAYCRQKEITQSVFRRWQYRVTGIHSSQQLRKASQNSATHPLFQRNGDSLPLNAENLIKPLRTPRYFTLDQWKEIIEDWGKERII